MTLWTDIIDPATLTGYARAALEDYEERRGTLARWLPNRDVSDIVVRFVKGQTGLVDVAKFRAYDAPPEVGARKGGQRVTLELPALGQDIPVSEYDRLRAAGGTPTDAAILGYIQTTTRQVVQAVSDSIERMRGVVLATGKATIDQDNYVSDDDFGRPAAHQLVAPTLWSTTTADGTGDLEGAADQYEDTTGERPGAIVMSRRVLRAYMALEQNATQLLNGGSRQASMEDVNRILDSRDLPPIVTYNRRVQVGGVTQKVLPDDGFLMVPGPVATDDWMGTDLGATFWGRTLSSLEADWAIPDDVQPGIVAGVYRHDKPPHSAEVIGDAIGLPVLANADRSLWEKVL